VRRACARIAFRHQPGATPRHGDRRDGMRWRAPKRLASARSSVPAARSVMRRIGLVRGHLLLL